MAIDRGTLLDILALQDGLARGIGAINLNVVRDVFASWIVTIPAGAGLAIIFYYTLAGIFT